MVVGWWRDLDTRGDWEIDLVPRDGEGVPWSRSGFGAPSSVKPTWSSRKALVRHRGRIEPDFTVQAAWDQKV